MDISWIQVYLITRFDGIKMCLAVSSAVVFAVSVLLAAATLDMFKDVKLSDLKFYGYGILSSIFLVGANVLTPTTKEAAAILVIPKVVQSSEVKKTCGEIYNLASDWLEYLKPPKENGGKKTVR